VKKEFAELERRIGRLKEVEKQLAGMDIEGFEEEAKSIKLKLKNPQALKEVESGMKDLVKIVKQRDTQKMNEAASARAMKEKEQLRLKKEMDDLERRITRLKELENHLNNMNVEGFELTANSIKAKLKDPKAVERIEEDLKTLEDKLKQRDTWQTKGASLLETAIKKSSDGVALFNSKEYLKALRLFGSAITDLGNTQPFSLHDKDLLYSIEDNMLSCRRNMIACNLGEGSSRMNSGQNQFKNRNLHKAEEEFIIATNYFKDACTIAAEINDDKKKLHAEKLISSTSRLIEQCFMEQDSEKVEKIFQDARSLLAEAIADRDGNNMRGSMENLAKAEDLANDALIIMQKRKLAQFEQSLKKVVVDIDQFKKSIKEIEARESNLKDMRARFAALNLAGFEEEADSFRTKLKDPEDINQIEQEMVIFENKVKLSNLWKTTGANIFESALESCKKASQAFYSKEYEKALALFSEGITKFTDAKNYAQHDNHLLISTNENITAARKNVLASNLGLGAQKSEIAQNRFIEGNYDQAIAEFKSALAYFVSVMQLASELKDTSKHASAEKLINITNNNINDCQIALDRYWVNQAIITVNQLIEESQLCKIRKDYKDAKQKLVTSDRICRDTLATCQRRDFNEEITNIEKIMGDIEFRMTGIGKEPLPRIEEVQIDITIDDSDI